ncbi:M48 family metallopeptidase [Streptomonospora sp. PA3]|uniref:M48 family metallopeptidase n=1 Tax=Streptomonospora sp. PA3 TaxID=2607326 RepID=UPI0012DBDF9C|nr:M48 family metallopeptidase [Streptomonospora sp. PA3]MUL40350.1 M48 family metallopeptidase [Streptomonospora sp. PA3]
MTHTAASDGGPHRLQPLRSAARPRTPHTAAARAAAALPRREPQLRPARVGTGSVRAPADPGARVGGAALTEFAPVARHPWEWPLAAAAAAVTACLLAAVIHTLLTGEGAAVWAAGLVLAGVPAGCWAEGGLQHAKQRAQSVRISPTQFPEAHHAIRRLSAQMGLACAPDAYVHPAADRPRSWAAGHGRRGYVVVSGDLFDSGGRLRDPDALRFVVAHQLGHIAAGHTALWLRAATAAGRAVPVLGASLSRAMEYTADNHAHAHCPEGVHAIRMLAGGAHLYAQVNMSEMAERARTDRGPFLLLYNLLSSRPANTKRMAALRDRTRPGRVFL